MNQSNDQKNILQLKRFNDYLKGKEGQILLGAFQCIAEKGIAATSTRAIAKKAGLNQGIIHYYFRSKEQLLEKLLELLFHNFTTNIDIIATSNLATFEKLESVLNSGLLFIGPRKEEFIVFIAYWAHAKSTGGEMFSLFQELLSRFRSAMITIIKEGESKSVFKKEISEEFATLIIGMIQGLGLQYVMDEKLINIEESATLLKEMFRSAMKNNNI